MANNVYRNDQVDFTIAAEAALGAYPEANAADDEASSPLSTTLDVAASAGDRTINVASTTNAAVSDYIKIGTESTNNMEIRRIVSFVTNDTITLNAPLGFSHANSAAVLEQDADSGILQGLARDSNLSEDFIRFTPGVWETIEVPDPVMDIEGRYLLGPAAKRNFYVAYEGQQSFTGTLPNIELLNAYPLRFPIGTVATVGTDTGGGGGSALASGASKGDYVVDLTSGTGYLDNDYIQIGTGTTAEVRKVTAVSTNKLFLDYPLSFDHGADTCNEVTSPYTHTISEAVDLDSMTWQVKHRDSGETAANDWIRRYIGGKVGQATITAEEGGTLRMSWESMPFVDMLHNQRESSALSETPKFSDSIQGMTPEYPTTKPYYFSQGAITLFGVEFARIANFTINVNNNVEPRYFLRNDGSERTPSAIYEGRREYSMTATIVLPDSGAETSTARSLFKELLAEGDYGSGNAGFDISLVFTRGTNDTITFTLPPSAASTGGNAQGAFIRSANSSVSTDNPTSAEVDILFRSLEIVAVDSEPVYP